MRSYVRACTIHYNERALERGIITLREFLVATSRRLHVGVGIVVDDVDVPEVAEEIVLGDALEAVAEEVLGGALEPEVAIEEPEEDPDLPEVILRQQISVGLGLNIPAIPPPVPEPEVALNPESLPVQMLCNICIENPSSLILRPCGHLLCSIVVSV